MRPYIRSGEERCLLKQHAQDLQYYCVSEQQETAGEGVSGRHLLGCQYRPIPYRILYNPQ